MTYHFKGSEVVALKNSYEQERNEIIRMAEGDMDDLRELLDELIGTPDYLGEHDVWNLLDTLESIPRRNRFQEAVYQAMLSLRRLGIAW